MDDRTTARTRSVRWALRLTIELEPGSTPIRGTTRREGDDRPWPFEGWIELASRIEQLHVGPDTPQPPAARPDDPSSA